MSNRVIILDTETTGLSPKIGHRVIEIACLEMVDRELTGKKFHTYLQPYRFVEISAFMVHGISDAFLADKPRFKDIGDDLGDFLVGAEIVAHNASFDMGFLNNEFMFMGYGGKGPTAIEANYCKALKVTCTKKLAESKFGRGGNKLDELCDKFGIDRMKRSQYHGALIDCELLAAVYLKLTEDN